MTSNLFWKKYPVGTDGFVCLVDVMGDDQAIVQAARVSYRQDTRDEDSAYSMADDRNLIRYMMRHHHGTPFEMCELKFLVRVPMDTWRQWIRHRTACLAGDVKLEFDLPGSLEENKTRKSSLYTLTMKEIYDRFQPTKNTQRLDKQRNPYHKKERVQAMNLRCVNEVTGEMLHTNIVDIWQTGVKLVYIVTLENGEQIRCTDSHQILTPNGWRILQQLKEGDEVSIIAPTPILEEIQPNQVDDSEEWAGIIGWEDYYEISTQGRVRRIVGGCGSASYGRCKKLTICQQRFVTSLNRPGEQVVVLVHQEMLKAFVGPKPYEKAESCHKDGNPLNNTIENLYWGTSKQNGEDMIRHKHNTLLRLNSSSIVSIIPDKEEMTYDIEVAGPWHNFSANGIVVHNSVNETSTRYAPAIDSMEKARVWRSQSMTNKQGSADPLFPTDCELLSRREEEFQEYAQTIYKQRLAMGVAREQARKDLPLSTYTEAYWKIDLRNLFNFLFLRMDSHAQLEIREYANAISCIVEQVFPIAWEAFVDYRLSAMTLSATEIEAVQTMSLSHITNKREREECQAKLKRLRIPLLAE